MSVLVGIITHNRCPILPRAIRSVLSQDYPDVEVAVVDDGSQDGTPSLRSDFPAIQWERWETPCGYLEGRNHLMQTAGADYYVSLDDDAWFMGRDEIAVAIRHLEDHPKVAAVAFDILSPDRTQPASRSEARPVHIFIGCGHVLRMSAVRECGFYAPTPGFYGSEEKDLCLRLLDHGWEIHLLPGVHVWHDKTMAARNQPAQYRSDVCNDLVFALRRCPPFLLIGALPYKCLSHLRYSVRRGLLRSCLSGFRLFLRNVVSVWESREPVRPGTFREFRRRARETS